MESQLKFLLPVLFVGGLLLLVGWAFYSTRQHSLRQREAWSAFAERRDWGYTARGSTLALNILEAQGPHRGYQVSLLTEPRSHGRKRHMVTVLRVDLSNLVPPELALTPEDRLRKLSGGKDAEQEDAKLGHAELDSALELQGVTPRARELLQGGRVQKHLLKAHKAYAPFSIENGLLEAVQRGVPETPEALEALMAPALELVDALDEAARELKERRA